MTAAQSHRPENVMVDGQLSEWPNPLPNYDKETLLYYDVYNDKEFLYLAVKRAKWAGKLRGMGRMVFEVTAPQGDNNRFRIIYPSSSTHDETEMWNYLEVYPVKGKGADTVTIYNDYGIQAAGRWWKNETQPGKEDKVYSPLGTVGEAGGADCELAIPLKLLPATGNGYTIKIILSGDAASPGAAGVLSSLSSWEIPADIKAATKDGLMVTRLSITYPLK